MSKAKQGKLNELLADWPAGAIYTSTYLKERGYGSDLLNGYKQSGWITSFGRGAYVRMNDTPSWEGGVFAIQQQLELPVYVGGFTALILQGYAHFVSPKINKCHLYSSKKLKLPKWFRSHDWEVDILLHILTLFGLNELGLKEIKRDQLPIKVASPERAILEMLSHVDSEASFVHSWQIMEGLTTLRPKLVQELLELCNSVKVTRLCLYMGEKNQMQWFKHLKPGKLDLGKGKRSIVKGGKLNKNYQITVPRNLENEAWT